MFVKLVDPKVRAAFVATQNLIFFVVIVFVPWKGYIWGPYLGTVSFKSTVLPNFASDMFKIEIDIGNKV